MAKQRMQAGLSLGPSFAELCAINSSGEVLFQSRAYLPKEPLRELFRRWALETEGYELTQLNISNRALEKIFATRLGGSVAQIVTAGFETWPWLRQPMSEDYFSMSATRTEPLASQELIFGITERVSAEGKLLKAVDLEPLQFISAKLKLMNVQKVCLNLLFSHLNPVNEEKAKAYFREEGFEVFCRTRLEKSTDEVTAWRTNILNACLSGTFLEMEREIRESLKTAFPATDAINVRYVNSAGCLEETPLQNISGILFGWSGLIKSDTPVLHLGLEKWSWVEPENCNRWQSPWGSVEVPHKDFKSLPVQPTCLLEKDLYQEISWGDEATFEPGPMSFGRSQRPLLVDFLLHTLPPAKESFSHLTSAQGESRFTQSLHLLEKTSSTRNLAAEIFDGSLRLSLLNNSSNTVKLSGYWAEILMPSYKMKFPSLQFELLSSHPYEEALNAAKLN